MKALKNEAPVYIAFFLIMCMAFVFIALFLSAYNEIIPQSPQDLEKYPELSTFFDAAGEFKKGSIPLDCGATKLVFIAKNVDSESFFNTLNAKVAIDGWVAEKDSACAWNYKKKVKQDSGKWMLYIVYVNHRRSIVVLQWDRHFLLDIEDAVENIGVASPHLTFPAATTPGRWGIHVRNNCPLSQPKTLPKI